MAMGCPPDMTSENILEWFSRYGNITFFNITRAGQYGLPSAIIHFEPMPTTAFWKSGQIVVPHSDTDKYPKGYRIKLSVDARPDRLFKSRSNPIIQYPARVTRTLDTLDFGCMVGPTSLNIRKSVYARNESDIFSLELDAPGKRLVVIFPLAVEKVDRRLYTRQMKILAELSQLQTAFYAKSEGKDTFIFPFTRPPQYFWKSNALEQAAGIAPHSIQPQWHSQSQDFWKRAADIMDDDFSSLEFPVTPNTPAYNPAYVDVGRWTALRLTVDAPDESGKLAVKHLRLALEDMNIKFQVCDEFHVSKDRCTMWGYLDHRIGASEDNALTSLLLSNPPFVYLDFGVRYQLEVCVSRRLLNEHTMDMQFLEKLAELHPLDAKNRLELLADQEEVVYDPMLILTRPPPPYRPATRIPQHCVLVQRATITPTCLLLNTPAVETSNRVLRRYSHLQDRFLRVQFVEESECGRLLTGSSNNHTEVLAKLARALFMGIHIADRRYEFLAFGNSQLRQCAAYFFCPTNQVSCDDIRQWMGQVDHIRIVAKHAARLGQCFSTTRDLKGVPIPNVQAIPDIERNGYCFSDGVGKISAFMAQMIVQEIPSEVYNNPSAFQFRMGGCKGVLVVWPEARGSQVHIRESQEKFKTGAKGLEIIKCAKYACATLNRQTITVLEHLGVPTQSFMHLLEKQISLYEEASKDNDVAIDTLKRFVDENQTSLVLAELLQAGFKTDACKEPFVINLLNLWRSWSLKLLKEKARIVIEQSAFVLGCVDETGTLRGHSNATEGTSDKDVDKLPQIFLQVSDSKVYDTVRVIKGVCIVGRNPSLHPGDIRVVEAVDVPELHHIKDVVVFPSTGDRPVPQMLSGGDLDGDDFFVIWDPSLIPATWNYAPMNYSSPPPPQLDKDVTVDDLRNFFMQYLWFDVLPLIATAHLAMADSDGLASPICLELAALHSKAVDYPKTGLPAEFTHARHNPNQWPHFMEKRSSYRSRKALGVIYDRVVEQSIRFRPEWDYAFDERILNRFQLDTAMLKAARQIKTQYDSAVRRALKHHNLDTEFELYTSWAMTKPRVGTDYQRQEELGKEFGAIKEKFRDLCYEAAGGHDEDKIDMFVAAMYKITEQEIKIALFEHHRGATNEGSNLVPARKLEPKSMPLISFPWIFPWVMIRLASDNKCDAKSSILAAAHRVPIPTLPVIYRAPEVVAPAPSSSAEPLLPQTTLTDEENEGVCVASEQERKEAERPSLGMDLLIDFEDF
ncbi:RNA dependent RNA polymerase domain-containing protein [Trichoderma austrokoningii]